MFCELFEFAFWPDSGASFAGLVESLDEVPGEKGDEYCSADGESDNDFLPGEALPVGLEVVDESGDGESESDKHDDEEESFPDDAFNDFLPGVGGDEA